MRTQVTSCPNLNVPQLPQAPAHLLKNLLESPNTGVNKLSQKGPASGNKLISNFGGSPTPSNDYGQQQCQQKHFQLLNNRTLAMGNGRRRATDVLMGSGQGSSPNPYPLTERKNNDLFGRQKQRVTDFLGGGQGEPGGLTTNATTRRVKFADDSEELSSLLNGVDRSRRRGETKSQSAVKYRRTLSMNDYKQFKYIDQIQQKYQFGEELGKGAFGKVLRCKHLGSGSDFAIKIMEKKMIRQRKVYVQLLENELAILGSKSHPKIIRVIDLLEDRQNYYIVSEVVEGGELFKRLQVVANFTEDQACDIIV